MISNAEHFLAQTGLTDPQGIHSTARREILGVDKTSLKTGLAAYRATLDVEKIRPESDIAWIVEKPGQNIW